MLFRSRPPCAPLRGFVEDFWLYEGYTGDHPRERILPSGTFEMVFNLREDELRIYDPSDPTRYRRYGGAVISGPYSGSFMSDTAEEAAIMGVHFRPGGASAVLGLSAQDFADAHVELGTIWGPAAADLREQLCASADPTQRFRLLEQALMERFSDRARRHGAVRVALDVLAKSHGRAKVRDISKMVDLSQRRLIDVFATEVGLTPKLFGRIQRFQHAVARSRADAVDWAQIAVDCGYFDQSHLIREFTEFCGATPSEYRRRQRLLARTGIHVKRNHFPLAE